MYRSLYFLLTLFALSITSLLYPILPGIEIPTATCCFYATMGCIGCTHATSLCCTIGEQNSLKNHMKDVKEEFRHLNKIINEQRPPLMKMLKHTTEQESNTDLSLITPNFSRSSFERKMPPPPTPPSLKDGLHMTPCTSQ